MKKLFSTLFVLAIVSSTSAFAVCNLQYAPSKYLNDAAQATSKKEQAVTDKVNKVQAEQKAKKEKAEKKKAEQKAKLQKKKDAINTLKSL